MPEYDLPFVPEDDDLNATIIEVMTDVEVGDRFLCCGLCATKTCRSH